MKWKLFIGLAAMVVVILSGSWVRADWVQDNGSLNVDPLEWADFYSSLFPANNTPYVAWSEVAGSTEQVYMKHWNGAAWVADGGSLNVDANHFAMNPSLYISANTPYVTWYELSGTFQVYVKHWNGVAWVADGGSLNVNAGLNAGGASISVYNGTPYVSFSEADPSPPPPPYTQLYVKRWNGASWVQLGGSLNVDVNMNANASLQGLDIYNGTPYVAWYENAGSANNQIYVKRWNGAAWLQNGGSLNVDVNQSGYIPSLALYNGSPYVAWYEDTAAASQVYVKRWNGAAWLQNGGSLNVDVNRDAINPSLALYNGTPYVAFRESDGSSYSLYVKQWNGASWVQIGSNLTLDVNRLSGWPSLNFVNDTPYVSWMEENNLADRQIYVKHYQSPTFTATPTHTPTRTVTRTATPTPSATPSITPTPSRTMTPSATATYASPTQTGTFTATSTLTPTATATPVSTQTATATATWTATSAVSTVDLAGREVIAYPNPARERMRFILNLEASVLVKVEIYNAAGERVATLAGTLSGPGAFLAWDCANHAPGAYYARVFKAGQELATLKVALTR